MSLYTRKNNFTHSFRDKMLSVPCWIKGKGGFQSFQEEDSPIILTDLIHFYLLLQNSYSTITKLFIVDSKVKIFCNILQNGDVKFMQNAIRAVDGDALRRCGMYFIYCRCLSCIDRASLVFPLISQGNFTSDWSWASRPESFYTIVV